MSGRIWPGALCEVRGATITTELNGRFVVAVRVASPGEYLGHGRFYAPSRDGAGWIVVSAVDGATLPVRNYRGDFFEARQRVVAQDFLFPILPPPASDTTEDRAPVEHGIAHA